MPNEHDLIEYGVRIGLEIARREFQERFSTAVSDAVRAGEKAVLGEQKRVRERVRRARHDTNLHNTRLLMRKYKMLKLHFTESVYEFKSEHDEQNEREPGTIWEIMNGNPTIDEVFIESIYRSSARTAALIYDIDHMLDKYQATCRVSNEESMARRCRVLFARYIDEPTYPLHEIAEREHVSTRTAERDLAAALEDLSALLFGVDGIKDMEGEKP